MKEIIKINEECTFNYYGVEKVYSYFREVKGLCCDPNDLYKLNQLRKKQKLFKLAMGIYKDGKFKVGLNDDEGHRYYDYYVFETNNNDDCLNQFWKAIEIIREGIFEIIELYKGDICWICVPYGWDIRFNGEELSY